ncbi:unnamed protein product [Caenorhabditis auriculariae]|uniref:SSD domain-containing protein n=1 Tax=Caenorhabditis auriculariae TaxID=2777116 RepID=A0A8S1HA09_9PELO|nr:unnamed protein product [Caenorhabditis auriculariae]
MGASSKITRLWNTACYRVGIAVAKNPIPTIVFCVLLTALATAKVALTEQVSAIDGYAMDDARSREEFSTFQQFLDSDGPGITLGILVKATDGGSLLREKYLKETVELADFVSTNFKLNTSGVMRNFNEFCHGFCQANEPVVQYYNGIQLLGANKTDGISQRIDLSYPTSSFFGREFSLIPNFFGIELEADGKTLKSSTLILLYFRAERHRDWTTKMVKGWELDVRDHFASYQSSLLTVDVMSQTVVESEIVRAGMSLQPFLVVGFVIMAIFCALTTMASAVFLYSQKPSWNKVALAIIACLNPFMACGTAFGAVFALGVTFSPILCITPFLVLAISVDDSFLMLHAWNRLEASRKVPLDRKTRQNHMAEVLVETGPAITISALTNILAFGVGAMTSPSEIRIFCYGNAAAIFMDMVYQATFYTAVMTLLADEKEQTTNEKICRIQDQMKEFVTKFLRSYIDFISNTFVSTAIVALWLIFIAFAVFGLTHLSVKLNPGKFFMKDSPMIRMDHMRTNDVVPYYTPVTVVINNPGDLSNDTVLEGLNNLKRRFESLPNSIGPNSTKFFLSDFIAFRESVDEESEMVEDDEKTDIEKFLEWPEYSFWRGFMNIDNKTKTVSKFMFSTGYHGEQLKDWSQRGKLLNEWRAAVDEFKEPFNATVFTEDAFFLDMIEPLSVYSVFSADTFLSAFQRLPFSYRSPTDFFASVVRGLPLSYRSPTDFFASVVRGLPSSYRSPTDSFLTVLRGGPLFDRSPTASFESASHGRPSSYRSPTDSFLTVLRGGPLSYRSPTASFESASHGRPSSYRSPTDSFLTVLRGGPLFDRSPTASFESASHGRPSSYRSPTDSFLTVLRGGPLSYRSPTASFESASHGRPSSYRSPTDSFLTVLRGGPLSYRSPTASFESASHGRPSSYRSPTDSFLTVLRGGPLFDRSPTASFESASHGRPSSYRSPTDSFLTVLRGGPLFDRSPTASFESASHGRPSSYRSPTDSFLTVLRGGPLSYRSPTASFESASHGRPSSYRSPTDSFLTSASHGRPSSYRSPTDSFLTVLRGGPLSYRSPTASFESASHGRPSSYRSPTDSFLTVLRGGPLFDRSSTASLASTDSLPFSARTLPRNLSMIPAITWQSTLATFVCVSAVCFLFIADLFTVLIVSTSILVTCIGVFGYLALFGVSLDPVIMSIAIMCIGFSVDIPAHVSFHFYAAKAKTAQRRSAPAQISAIDLVDSNKTISMEPEMSFRECLSSTLTSVGFPVIQAGVSTDFCALPLAFLDLYMARMFAAALTLCVSLSLLHGLVIIPALLSVYYKLKAVITSRNRK